MSGNDGAGGGPKLTRSLSQENEESGEPIAASRFINQKNVEKYVFKVSDFRRKSDARF